MIKEITDKETFNQLANHVCQSFQWGEFRADTSSIKKVLRLGAFENEKLVRVWQILFSRVPLIGHYSIAYLPRGEMPTNSELNEIRTFCVKENAVFLKIEPFEYQKEAPVNDSFIKGKAILPQHTIFVDLTLTEEKLLLQMHEKTRYNIGLAQRKGVSIREENTAEGLEKFINILEETSERQSFFSHDANYYRKLWQFLSREKIAHILNAYVEGKVAASVMLFQFKDFLYYPYGGSAYELRQFKAPQLIHFEAMKLGKKLGCKTYDLWGSYKDSPTEDDPWWGFYRLKSGLGGRDVEFPQTVDVPFSPLYRTLMTADDLRWKLLRLRKKI